MKCPVCGERGQREGMVYDDREKRYYHVGKCHQYLLDERMKPKVVFRQCDTCKQKSSTDEMAFDDRSNKFYHTGLCYETYLKQREFTDIENLNWDTLYQYIKELHDLGDIPVPDSVIVRIQNLRAGFIMKNGKKVRQWKNGPRYEIILEAYHLAEEKIKESIMNKFNGESSDKVMHYGISIMISMLLEANERIKYRRKQEAAKLKTTTLDMQITESEIKEVKIVKDDMDISSFI